MAVDKTKPAKALWDLCKKAANTRKGAFGTILFQNGTAVVQCEQNTTTQLARAMLAYFKANKISLKVEELAGDAPEATEDAADEEDAEASSSRPAASKAEKEGEGEGDEDIPEGKCFDPEIIIALIRRARKVARPFAFGITPERQNILAMHPRLDGDKLARKLRQEGARKGVWGTVQLDGAVAVFACEKEPFAGVKKGLRRWFKDQGLAIKFRLLGPEGDFEDPEDDEIAAEASSAAATSSDAAPANPDIERMRAQLANAKARLDAAQEQDPDRADDIRRERARFEAAAAAGDVAGARDALQALAALSRLSAESADNPPRGSFVALQKSRLDWDALRKNIQTQLQSLEKSIFDAVRAHNADPAAEDIFEEEEVTLGVGQLYRILDGLDTRLIDKLDEALNSEGDQRRARHAEAARIVEEYQSFVDSDPLIGEIDENGFLPTSIRGDALSALGALARQL
ncbi:hypothetical protein [Radicibacter daui]|uniref:hypothetical protein n=1 Tax=Radicibacter daui TaxID=3064829 RepID=UPI004046F0D1